MRPYRLHRWHMYPSRLSALARQVSHFGDLYMLFVVFSPFIYLLRFLRIVASLDIWQHSIYPTIDVPIPEPTPVVSLDLLPEVMPVDWFALHRRKRHRHKVWRYNENIAAMRAARLPRCDNCFYRFLRLELLFERIPEQGNTT